MMCKHWKASTLSLFPGSNPKCAFNKNGVFVKNNWNCKLMNKLRDKFEANEKYIWNGDEYVVVLPYGDYEFAILAWYKHRGKTDGFWISDGMKMRRGTITDAKILLKTVRK